MAKLKLSSSANFYLAYHLALITRYRRPVLSEAMLSGIEGVCRTVLSQWECELTGFAGGANYALLSFEANPSVAPARLVNRLKTATSRELRRRYGGERGLWALSYAITSAEGAGEEELWSYIRGRRRGARQLPSLRSGQP